MMGRLMISSENARTEYEALRATIRERGTRRVTLFWMALGVWAALLLTAAVRGAGPYASLVSLLSLAAGFEAVYALHVGVERIGRYLQVFYEEPGTLPAWERTAMAYGRESAGYGREPAGLGREPAGDGVDPLFSKIFATAALLNFVPTLPSRQFGFIFVLFLAHGLFAVRILKAQKYAAAQRGRDLERFKRLKNEVDSGQ